MHDATAHHPLTDTQPGSEQQPGTSFPPSLYADGMECSFGQFGSAVLAHSPLNFLWPPAYTLVRWDEKVESPWLSVNTA